MRKTSSIIIIIICLFFFTYCKKDVTNPFNEPIVVTEYLTRNVDTAKQLIQGKWVWLQTKRINSAGVKYSTPQTDGYTLSSIFSNDTSFVFKNEIQTGYSVFNFGLRKEFTGVVSDSMPVIIYYDNLGNKTHFMPYLISKNYLVLQGQYVNAASGESINKKVK